MNLSTFFLWPRNFPQPRLAVVFLVFSMGMVFQALIPPFQSPDEFSHVKRAYLFARGQLFLDRPVGHYAGGQVDVGLLSYFDVYKTLPYTAENKFSAEEALKGEEIKWAGERRYSPFPGTAYYFPAVYLPQAAGLWVGERLGWSVESSYELARGLSWVGVVVLLWAALAVFPASPAMLALLILPMNLLQFVSASLDGLTTAMTVLAVSLFMRGMCAERAFPRSYSFLMLACIFLVATSRIHMSPLVFLPLLVYRVRRDRWILYSSLLVLALSVSWILSSMAATYIARATPSGMSTFQIALFYIKNPLDLIFSIWGTLQDSRWMEFYGQSFVGVLGWLDAYFSPDFYSVIGTLLAVLFLASVDPGRELLSARVALVALSVFCCFLVFFALLLTWNPLSPNVIAGLQGRYFIGPAVLLAYSLAGKKGVADGALRKVAVLVLMGMAVYSLQATTHLVIERYFLAKTADPSSVTVLKEP